MSKTHYCDAVEGRVPAPKQKCPWTDHENAEPMETRQHDSEPTECTGCGATFDLARQDYYGPICPDCKSDLEG